MSPRFSRCDLRPRPIAPLSRNTAQLLDKKGIAGGFTATILILLALFLSGCATPRIAPIPEGFTPLGHDARIWRQTDGDAYAKEVSALLDRVIAKVEAVHGLPFLRPPRVFVCAGKPCFRQLIATPGYTAVVLPGEILALSPRLEMEENERLPTILAHELSHLHLGQRLGHYTADIPIWFHEGLASLVGDGGGAEYSSDEDACNAWDSGRRIDFAQLDTPARRYRAADFKMSIHQFYRQAWRFMQYLQRRDPEGFADMLYAIQSGTEFVEAVTAAYHTGLEQLSLEFEFDSR